MIKQELEKIVNYIVEQELKAIKDNTEESNLPIDYMGIFAEDENEFIEMEKFLNTLGKTGDTTATSSGSTFILDEPLETPAGQLKVLKVRRPDLTRTQRGAPDFQIEDYKAFKEKYFLSGKNSNFALMVREKYEMLELKGNDVLVYFPNNHFDNRQV